MSSAVATAVFLFVTAILLTAAEIWSRKTRQLDSLKPLDAGIIGLFQAVSIFPGISRSGATISGGQWRGLTRESAAKFSFLMSIPIMLAAGALEMLDLFKTPGLTQMVPQLLIGFIIAGVVGYFSIRWFLRYLKSKSLLPFALYCAVLAIVMILSPAVRRSTDRFTPDEDASRFSDKDSPILINHCLKNSRQLFRLISLIAPLLT